MEHRPLTLCPAPPGLLCWLEGDTGFGEEYAPVVIADERPVLAFAVVSHEQRDAQTHTAWPEIEPVVYAGWGYGVHLGLVAASSWAGHYDEEEAHKARDSESPRLYVHWEMRLASE